MVSKCIMAWSFMDCTLFIKPHHTQKKNLTAIVDNILITLKEKLHVASHFLQAAKYFTKSFSFLLDIALISLLCFYCFSLIQYIYCSLFCFWSIAVLNCCHDYFFFFDYLFEKKSIHWVNIISKQNIRTK